MVPFLHSYTVRRLVATLLSAAAVLLLLSTALAPDIGAIPAQGSCEYGNCSSPTNTTPAWAWAAVGGILLLIIILAALLLLRHRRRGGPSSAYSAVPPDAGVAVAAGTPGDGGPGAGDPTVASAPVGAAVPAYVETEDDIGAPPTVMPPAPAPAAAAAAAPSPEEPNIDSLMDELDRISGEILKKDPKAKGGSSAGAPDEESGGAR